MLSMSYKHLPNNLTQQLVLPGQSFHQLAGNVLRRKYVTAKTNGKTFRLQLDTASDITLVSKRTWKKIGCPRYTPTTNTARNASEGKINLLGEFEWEMEITGKRSRGSIFFVDRELDLLGIDRIDRLQLTRMTIDELCSSTPNQVKKVDKSEEADTNTILSLQNKYAAVFTEGLGCCA
ncbi:unnamed protein product [Echinostoma caproni]|uniref:Peptidase A2 domain-containing protein n=1 Tax=Echinostoma caproni TaxID=27848 RepID=A0A183B2P4_9TREM|nr:unnamed protein product [Echinostoma caproni]